MLDYHVHTTIRDGVHSIEENIEFAIYKGLKEIGISEHYGIMPDDFDTYFGVINFGIDEEELKFKKISPFSMRGSLRQYFTYIDIAKEKYKDQIIVKKGLEMDLFASNADYSYNFVNSLNPDYIIGSIHSLNQIGFHDLASFKKIKEQDYIDYLEALTEYVKQKKMDIVGHCNLYNAFIDFPDYSILYPSFEKLVKTCQENNIAIEYNTGCLTEKFELDYYFISLCGKYNVPLIVTSDAHNKNNIGNMFPLAFKVMKKAGVKYTATFENREMTVKEIDYNKALGTNWFPSEYVIW